MFSSFWRRPCNGNPRPARQDRPRRGRPCPPRLEALEDRVLPALGAVAVPAPGAVSGLQPIVGLAPLGAGRMKVTVTENAGATVINLGPVFGAMGGLRPKDGLHLSLLGN